MTKEGVRDIGISLVVSIILSQMSFTSILFPIPLLALSKKYNKKEISISFVVLALFIIGKMIFDVSSLELEVSKLSFLSVQVFIPLSLVIGSITWVLNGNKELVRRILYSVLSTFILFFAIVIWFSFDSEMANSIYSIYASIYLDLLNSLLGTLVDGDFTSLVSLMIIALIHLAVSLVMLFQVLCFYISSLLSSFDKTKAEERISSFKIPNDFIWILLVSWALVLFARFITYPIQLNLVIWSVAGCITLMYAMQGFSILFSLIRRKKNNFRSIILLLILLAIFFFLVGINVVVVFGLPLLGIAETWITIRKRD